jgi:hypothetical protein
MYKNVLFNKHYLANLPMPLGGGLVPDVEASNRSGLVGASVVGWTLFGLVPEVEGVGDECGELEEEEPLELGGCGSCGGCETCGRCGAGTGAGTGTAGIEVVHSRN